MDLRRAPNESSEMRLNIIDLHRKLAKEVLKHIASPY